VRAVLGIDAAWTPGNPSGVALVSEHDGRWRLLRVASSYAEFLDEEDRGKVGGFEATALVARSKVFVGCDLTLIAADIPLSRTAITGRRTSDNLVSAAYGARHASTHTPSVTRPGPVSEQIRLGFSELGYKLRTEAPISGGLIEVYPHPALIELAGAAMRLPYKESKIRKYWPALPMAERRVRLLSEWQMMVELLDAEIDGVRAALAPVSLPAPRTVLKAYEDALDAVVCAWVGICALDARAVAFGDADSAIWIPMPSARGNTTFANAEPDTPGSSDR
jgi:predicted RNase H-like nuclease